LWIRAQLAHNWENRDGGLKLLPKGDFKEVGSRLDGLDGVMDGAGHEDAHDWNTGKRRFYPPVCRIAACLIFRQQHKTLTLEGLGTRPHSLSTPLPTPGGGKFQVLHSFGALHHFEADDLFSLKSNSCCIAAQLIHNLSPVLCA
jgi:hypothetical protein